MIYARKSILYHLDILDEDTERLDHITGHPC